jgi:SAM-dependent methyltransferase
MGWRILEGYARTLVPRTMRPTARHLYYTALDGLDFIAGRRDRLVPPKRLLRISTDPSSDYRATGAAFREFLVTHCGLRPDHAVLDVGCGVGRIAVALSGYLEASGRYEGFDIVPEEIAWCRRRVSPRFPNFHFHLDDISNQAYNPSGKTRASEYQFSYAGQTFDAAVVASVFTHIFAEDVERYVSEIARVLKPGGRCVASFYLLNARTRSGIAAGTSRFNFRHRVGRCYVDDADSPEWAVAHEEDFVRALFEREGLVQTSVMYGTWSSTGVEAQDLVIASRS